MTRSRAAGWALATAIAIAGCAGAQTGAASPSDQIQADANSFNAATGEQACRWFTDEFIIRLFGATDGRRKCAATLSGQGGSDFSSQHVAMGQSSAVDVVSDFVGHRYRITFLSRGGRWQIDDLRDVTPGVSQRQVYEARRLPPPPLPRFGALTRADLVR